MLVRKFPDNEKYRLSDQMIRASRSITANIAEGYGRYHFSDNMRFCRQSRGSIYELKDHLISCNDLGYIGYELKNEGEDLIESAKRTLNGYINFVKRKVFFLTTMNISDYFTIG